MPTLTTRSSDACSAATTNRAKAASACSGFSCTARSTTRFATHSSTAVRAIKTGDPRDEKTVVGPIISEDDAKRIEQAIKSAVEQGGKLLCGGGRKGRIVEPAVLENVPHDAEASCEEIFGPVTLIEPFDDFDDALATVNDSKYGLQAGVFTRDIVKIQKAWDELNVGGVLINEIPSWRADQMPYGGSKDSGLGREGVRWAIESMTEPRLLVIRTPKS